MKSFVWMGHNVQTNLNMANSTILTFFWQICFPVEKNGGGKSCLKSCLNLPPRIIEKELVALHWASEVKQIKKNMY